MDQNNAECVGYRVGTLNFSASIVSPYEFHEQPSDPTLFEYRLDQAFQEIALRTHPDFSSPLFDWGMAAVDLVWKDRFSPLYRLDCGVKADGHMMNEKEFLGEWDRQAQKAKTRIIQQGVQKRVIRGSKLPVQQIEAGLESQIVRCRDFDLIAYKAFIKVFYGVEDIVNLQIAGKTYKEERQKHFSKDYLKWEAKKERAIKILQAKEYDIFCIQECDRQFIRLLKAQLPTYILVEMPSKLSQICDSIILLKKSRFPGHDEHTIEIQRQKFLDALTARITNPGSFSKKLPAESIAEDSQMLDQSQAQDQESLRQRIHRQFFWNDDTCYCVIGPLIVFSPHISTKAELNQVQINEIKSTLVKIFTYFPEKYFICAGDLNGDFDNQLNLKTEDSRYIKVNAFPSHDDDLTCNKMRTFIQAQRNKALEQSFCKKDFIITDLRLVDAAVIMADGTQISKTDAPLIPNNRHPFDHFLVEGTVRMLDRIVSSSPLLKKDRLSKPFNFGNAP